MHQFEIPETIPCPKCEKRFAIMGLERHIQADAEIGSIRITYFIAPMLAKFCPLCGASVDPTNAEELEQIGRKAAKKAKRQLHQNGHKVLKTGEDQAGKGNQGRRVRRFGIVAGRMYGHEELIKIFGAGWRQRLKEARDSGPLKCSKEGAKILYDGADVINWRASLDDSK